MTLIRITTRNDAGDPSGVVELRAVELDTISPVEVLRFEEELAALPEREARWFLGHGTWEALLWERAELITDILSLPKLDRPKAAALDPRNRMVVRLNLWAAFSAAGVPRTLAEVMRIPPGDYDTIDIPEPREPQDRKGKAPARSPRPTTRTGRAPAADPTSGQPGT